jgi:hypothetical protein
MFERPTHCAWLIPRNVARADVAHSEFYNGD